MYFILLFIIASITVCLYFVHRHHIRNNTLSPLKEFALIERDCLEKLLRKAEFGNISEGLFHDLINPLTSISLYLEKMDLEKDTKTSRSCMERVVSISKNINNYIHKIKDVFVDNRAKTKEYTDIISVIDTVLDIYKFKFQKSVFVFKL